MIKYKPSSYYACLLCISLLYTVDGGRGEGNSVIAQALPPATTDSPLLDSLLRTNARLATVAQRAAAYELQILYTQIDRDAQNQPHFTQHSFQLNSRQYFNPASLVKLPTVALALEKLNILRQPGLTRQSPMATQSTYRCQIAAPYQPAADSDHVNTIGNYVKRMLLVSDNNAYNRLYEFLGQRPLNERLWHLGYPAVRITRRFAPCDTAANRHTNPINFYDSRTGQIIYRQPALVNPQSFSLPLGRITKGKAYQAGGRIIPQPYDFTTANYLPLQDVTSMLRAIMFPDAVSPTQRFQLTATDYAFLRHYLHSTPHGSHNSLYNSPTFFDAYKKYLYYGRQPNRKAQTDLRIYNIVSMSHGYLSDVAYFVNSAHNFEFMLSAVIYVNKNGVLNDGNYQYESIGLPFLQQLGRTIYQYENHRPRRFKPVLIYPPTSNDE